MKKFFKSPRISPFSHLENSNLQFNLVFACAEDRATLGSDPSADAGECRDGRDLFFKDISRFSFFSSLYSIKR